MGNKQAPPKRFWIVRQGTAKARIAAPDMAAAKQRAAAIGFKCPDAIVLAEPGIRY